MGKLHNFFSRADRVLKKIGLNTGQSLLLT